MKRMKFFILALTLALTSCMGTNNTSTNTSATDSSTTTSSMTLDDIKTTPKAAQYAEYGYKPLYQDINFKRQLRVSKTFYDAGESPHHEKTISLFDQIKDPFTWGIAQWSSRFDIMEEGGYTMTESNDGFTHRIVSKGKVVDGKEMPAKVVEINSIDGSIYLESNCQVEYEKPRVKTDPWVHLLLEQSFDSNGNDLVFVKDLQSLLIEANYEIVKFEDCMGEAADPSVHAAQFVWFITVQNRNKDSKGYGKYIWFGIPLWDNRSAGQTTDVYSAHDKGTDTLIYSMGSSSYLYATDGLMPVVGQKACARVDALDIIKTAFDDAKSKGYLSDTNYEDLAFGGTNFGFEMPGTYNIAASIDDIGIYYLNK